MLGQYRRRLADISLPLDQRLVLAEIQSPVVDVLRLGKKMLEICHSKVWCFQYYFILPHSASYITVCDDLR